MYGNYRLTGAQGETSLVQVMTNATNFTDWNVTENYADGSTNSYVYTPVLIGSSNTIIQTLLLPDNLVSVDFDLDGLARGPKLLALPADCPSSPPTPTEPTRQHPQSGTKPQALQR